MLNNIWACSHALVRNKGVLVELREYEEIMRLIPVSTAEFWLNALELNYPASTSPIYPMSQRHQV